MSYKMGNLSDPDSPDQWKAQVVKLMNLIPHLAAALGLEIYDGTGAPQLIHQDEGKSFVYHGADNISTS
jgi:hypothetical protein